MDLTADRDLDLMTTQEVADMLRKSPATLRYWRHIGQGPRSFKLGRAVVYERSDVLAFVSAQRSAASIGG